MCDLVKWERWIHELIVFPILIEVSGSVQIYCLYRLRKLTLHFFVSLQNSSTNRLVLIGRNLRSVILSLVSIFSKGGVSSDGFGKIIVRGCVIIRWGLILSFHDFCIRNWFYNL